MIQYTPLNFKDSHMDINVKLILSQNNRNLLVFFLTLFFLLTVPR